MVLRDDREILLAEGVEKFRAAVLRQSDVLVHYIFYRGAMLSICQVLHESRERGVSTRY